MRHHRIYLLLVAGALTASAEPTPGETFPPDAGIVNARDFGAIPDDGVDDTAAILRALEAKPTRSIIVFLPDGVYDLSNTVKFPKGEWLYSGNILQGQSRERTILRLRDGAAGFGDPDKPRPLLDTGGEGRTSNAFHNYVRRLTLETGRRNPGAIGLRFYANNSGAVRDVTIRSGDGAGVCGLQLGHLPDNGPLLVKHLRVEGFQRGVHFEGGVNGATFEFLELAGQRAVGFLNAGQPVTLRKFTSRNRVTAFENRGDGHAVLVEADLSGGSSNAPAVLNQGNNPKLLVRNLTSRGYGAAISNRIAATTIAATADAHGPRVEEWVSSAPHALFDSPARTLNLPIEETPELPWDDFSQWVSVANFGAKPADLQDDTAAIQAAIDSTRTGGTNAGKTTIYFPAGWTKGYPETASGYNITRLRVRGSVRRFVGGEAHFKGFPDWWNKHEILIEDEGPPVVEFDRIGSPSIVNRSSRTVIIRGAEAHYFGEGPGKAFLEDVVARVNISKGHTLFARQLNAEGYGGGNVVNDGGTLWILGLKTEGGHTIVETRGGGRTEILGGHFYTTEKNKSGAPMFRAQGAAFSASISEASFIGRGYSNYVEAAVDGRTEFLRRGDLTTWHYGEGMSLPLVVVNPAVLGRQTTTPSKQ